MFSLINLQNNCVLVRISWYYFLHPCFVVEQMLRSSGSTSKPRGWGRPLESKVRPLSPARHMETVDSDGEAAPAPGYRQSFGDAIAAALQATSIHSGKPLLLIDRLKSLERLWNIRNYFFFVGHAKSPVRGLAVYARQPRRIFAAGAGNYFRAL